MLSVIDVSQDSHMWISLLQPGTTSAPALAVSPLILHTGDPLPRGLPSSSPLESSMLRSVPVDPPPPTRPNPLLALAEPVLGATAKQVSFLAREILDR